MIYNIMDFGAQKDSVESQTIAIQLAADKCRDCGGGIINIPQGTFYTGTIRLYSNTTLYLEPGATLIGPEGINGYDAIPFKWGLYPLTYSLIYSENAENITISGKGTIDFNGRAFVRWEHLCTGLPEEETSKLSEEQLKCCHYEMPPREERPNRLIFFSNCKNVEILDINLKDSPTWATVFNNCQFVRICNVNIDNNLQVPNSDGIHCCNCQDVLITGCFISSGDDCIALTGIADYEKVSERIMISDCALKSASSAVRIGFEGTKIKHVTLKNCIIHNSNRGISIFTDANGWVNTVSISDLQIDTKIYPGIWWGKGEPLVVYSDGNKANISNIFISNIYARTENSIYVSGVENIDMRNIHLELSYGSVRPLYGSQIDLAPHKSRPAPNAKESIPWLITNNVKSLNIEAINVHKRGGEKYNFDTKESIS